MMFDKPLIASFWKNGKFIHFQCVDCVVSASQDYTEVVITSPDNTNSMFIISADREISDRMNGSIFDGFHLKDSGGKTIEFITNTDSKTTH